MWKQQQRRRQHGACGQKHAYVEACLWRQGQDLEVSFEVGGKGKTNVYYNLDTNHSEQVTLPWKKSDKLTLNSTERKVGITVSVVPGSVMLANGKFVASPCSITVDGKKVDTDPGAWTSTCASTPCGSVDGHRAQSARPQVAVQD